MSPEELDALLNAPALEPPPDVTPMFDSPTNRNDHAWGITTVCMLVATLCLCLRWYVRIWLDRKVRVEDVMAICAYGAHCGTAYAAYALIDVPGYYVHTWNLRNKEMVRPLYLILIYGCCYSVVLPLIKKSILLDWCRVFVPIDRVKSPFWWGCIAMACFQCLWGVLCIILLNTQCLPHRAIWEFYLQSKCYSLPNVMLCSASVQVISDVTMILLPQRIIWILQTSRKKRLGISVIFGAGILASIAACIRLAHTVAFASQPDSIYLIGPLLFWADAEMTCGFFIFSVPCLSKLIMESGIWQRVLSALGFSNTFSSRSNQSSDCTPRARSLRHIPKDWMPTIDSTWSRIDEEHIGLHNRSGSRTNLYGISESHAGKDEVRVQRALDVTVSSDGHPKNRN
ncbi:uncharacterized protein EURHEDRAFT_459029 [Aspergillus ruber CBS 135680]|uniref:Rhodopsin domain-containing protein n=1 Tax=Aspergillus ruber (strain CBS 135680) TaxID=1388766 RepID=A0A017SB69_ASPRC|nr:uncharacterized protein EURHEDRAFT_459029 [Aspergillus ruber CBS 135680]EYE93879.1 hypothetical protein EURHEDRAFT_459029 [Aspergillus ruber CBS 135680]